MVEIDLLEIFVWIFALLLLAQFLFNTNTNSDIRYLKQKNAQLEYELKKLKEGRKFYVFMDWLIVGGKVRRKSWDKGCFIYRGIDYLIYFNNASATLDEDDAIYALTADDLGADDWEFYKGDENND